MCTYDNINAALTAMHRIFQCRGSNKQPLEVWLPQNEAPDGTRYRKALFFRHLTGTAVIEARNWYTQDPDTNEAYSLQELKEALPLEYYTGF